MPYILGIGSNGDRLAKRLKAGAVKWGWFRIIQGSMVTPRARKHAKTTSEPSGSRESQSTRYSGLMFASFRTFAHLSNSDRTSACSASGVLPLTSMPIAASRAFRPGCSSTSIASRLRRATISFGVRAGANSA